MDTIITAPGASPFSVAFAYEPETETYLYAVSEGRVLIDFVLCTVEGISGSGDADIYLIADEYMTNLRLSTEPGEKFSKLIIKIRDAKVIWRDVACLCVGYAELQEQDTYEGQGEYNDFGTRDGNTSRGNDPPENDDDEYCDWCQRHHVDLVALASEVKDLVSQLIPKLQTISEKTGIEVTLPEIDFD